MKKLLLIQLLVFATLSTFGQLFGLKTIMEVKIAKKIGQLRAVPVTIGVKFPNALALMYSEEAEVDPWEGMFFFPKHTLKIAVVTIRGFGMDYPTSGQERPPPTEYLHFLGADRFGTSTLENQKYQISKGLSEIFVKDQSLRY